MGACREGFDVFNKYGRVHLYNEIKRLLTLKQFPWYKRLAFIPYEYFLKDSFGRFVCKIFGHNKLFICSDPGELVEFACYRCYRKLSAN